MTRERIAPYVLAGGLSSRMGQDKAMLRLGGKTLLARAVETLQQVDALRFGGKHSAVTVIGDRTLLEGATRAIADRHADCGPMGGMEAALADIAETAAADWALFIPVDMPFLSASLIDALLRKWITAAECGARVCYVVVDDRPQPLVSLVHRALHPWLEAALREGRLKVTPVLQSACDDLAFPNPGALGSSAPVLYTTLLYGDSQVDIELDWPISDFEKSSRPFWFANLNTQEEFLKAETFLEASGFTYKAEIAST